MAARIELAGGEAAFGGLLDRFFGFGEPAVKQLGVAPDADSVAAGYALDRFEGLNNEPDMEAPWAYHYIGRPDRTAEVVHAIIEHQFASGRGGLPGNDDSGGLSSWYVWASLGLFPVAGQHLVFVNAPSFASARIRVRRGTFVIDTTGFVEPDPDGAPQYVQSVSLDGVELDRTWITTAELHARRPPPDRPRTRTLGVGAREPSSVHVDAHLGTATTSTSTPQATIDDDDTTLPTTRDRRARRPGDLRTLGRSAKSRRGRARPADSTTSGSSRGRSRRCRQPACR